MNRFLCCIFFLVLSAVAFSQKQYFVYLQAETQFPFFVKSDEKVYSSTVSGYLILSKLRDSIYIFKVGFPQNKWPEQQFSVSIKSKDHGFLLKNFGEKGWGLFDLQSLSVIMADDLAKDGSAKSSAGEISAFTEILSRAANDPSLREKPVAFIKYDENPVVAEPAVVKETVPTPKEQPANSTVFTEQAATNRDSSLSVKKEPVKNDDIVINAGQQNKAEQSVAIITYEASKNTGNSANVEQSVKKDEMAVADKSPEKNKTEDTGVDPAANYKRSVVTRKSESSTTAGLGLIFIDEFANGSRDTIKIVIPNQTTVISKANNQPVEQKTFLNVTDEEKDISSIAKSGGTKKTCTLVATDNDFLKLRKKMAAQKAEEEMINEAKKVFKSKCFTTEQVKNLGSLFLTEAGKFQFYETAYPFNSDQNNFTSLQVEFKDAYFIHRFIKMVN